MNKVGKLYWKLKSPFCHHAFHFENNKKKLTCPFSQIYSWNRGGLNWFLFEEYESLIQSLYGNQRAVIMQMKWRTHIWIQDCKRCKIRTCSVTTSVRHLYHAILRNEWDSGVSWGVHSVRLHPGWPQGGAKKWPKGASKRGRRKEEEREEGEKEEKGRGKGKEKEKRKEKETKKRKGDIKWKERERKIKKKVTNGKRFKTKKL